MSAFGGSTSLIQAMASVNAQANASLSNLNDVTLTNPNTNDSLVFDSGSSKWHNQPNDVANCSDVKITLPINNNQVLMYNISDERWENLNLPSEVSQLSGLTDVTINLPANGQQLVYCSGSSTWVNTTITSQNPSLTSLVGVAISNLNNGDVLTFNTGSDTWNNQQPATVALALCSDVTITTPANRNLLIYNSTASKWDNDNLQASDIPSLAESKITNLTSDLASKVSSINTITPTSGDVSLGLSNLSDTSITTPTNNQFLQYNSSTSKWVNTSVTIDTTLSSLSDTNVAEGSSIDQNFLYWNNTDSKWEAKALQTTDIPSLAESKITNLTSDLASKVSSINTITPTSGDVSIGLSKHPLQPLLTINSFNTTHRPQNGLIPPSLLIQH